MFRSWEGIRDRITSRTPSVRQLPFATLFSISIELPPCSIHGRVIEIGSLAGRAIAYRSHTQSITAAQSSTAAELIAANSAAKVTTILVSRLSIMVIYDDNATCIKIVNHGRPIELRFFALQYWRTMGDIIFLFLPPSLLPLLFLISILMTCTLRV